MIIIYATNDGAADGLRSNKGSQRKPDPLCGSGRDQSRAAEDDDVRRALHTSSFGSVTQLHEES